ncbi:zinc finger protein 488 [Sturnira hondurensis]|uniref:zinc finger protein 488 n=1 Tax=Sturnira hondurensis TaxID=192404 RepID=UPI00187AE2B9|nr:zinc finger protein 488 [Sturnira hondurensis]XP_036912555.1 zinc finger protein 488 [Sturnira hondurensis]
MAAQKGILHSLLSENSQWLSEPKQSEGCKPMQLKKANFPGSEGAISRSGQVETSVELALVTPPGKVRLGKSLAQKVCWKQEQSTFMEVSQLKERLQGRQVKDREDGALTGQPAPQQLTQDIPRTGMYCQPAGSTVFSAWPSRAPQEQRSAFSKPARYLSGRPGSASLFHASRPADAMGELLGLIKMGDFPCWGQLSSSKLLVGDFWNLQMLPQNTHLCSALLGTPTLWLTHAMAQIPTLLSPPSPASWALLPPMFPSQGLSTQNWCAKCNLSFHMTSDLVFHMRSHHKKKHAGPDLHSKKLTEEALTCPICHEYFWERHHLSRHMTSHS